MLNVLEKPKRAFWKSSAVLKVLFVVAIGLLFFGNEAYHYVAVQIDLQRLQGEWMVLESWESGGYHLSEERLATSRREVTGDGYTVRWLENAMPKSLSAKWTLDPTREPKAVDLIFLSEGSSGNGLLRRGIYRIEGDRHILCLADRSDEERPTAFDSNLGTLVVWKRK